MAKAHKGTSVGKGYLMPRPGDLVWPLTVHDSGYRQKVTGVPAMVPMEPFGWGMTGYGGQSTTMTADWNLWTLNAGSATGAFRVHSGNKIATLARTGGTGAYAVELNQSQGIDFTTSTQTCGVIWVRIIKTDATAQLTYGFTHFRQDTGGALTASSRVVDLNGLPLGEWLPIPFVRSSTIIASNGTSPNSVRFVQINNGNAEVEAYVPQFCLGTVITPAGGTGDTLVTPPGAHSVTPVEGCLSFWVSSLESSSNDANLRLILSIGGKYSDSASGGGAFMEIRKGATGSDTLTVTLGVTATTSISVTAPFVSFDPTATYNPTRNVKVYWKQGGNLTVKIDDDAEVSTAYSTGFSTWSCGGVVGLLQNGIQFSSDVMWAPRAPLGTVVKPAGFSFSRASTAEYHRYGGSFVTEGIDEIRSGPWYTFGMGTDKNVANMVVEEGTTNILIAGRENFSTGWTGFDGSTATITQGITFLDGALVATRITTSGGTSTLKWFTGQAAIANGQRYVISMYARLVSASPTCTVTFNGGATVPLTTTWTRITSGPRVGTGAAACQIRFESASAGTNVDVYALRPQIELLDYDTTYNPPGVVRAPDVLTYDPALGTTPYTNESGSVSVLVNPSTTKLLLAGIPLEDLVIFEVGDETLGGDYIRYYKSATDGKLKCDFRNAGGTVKQLTSASIYNMSGATDHHFQATWSGTSVAAYVNGSGLGTATLDGAFTQLDTAVTRFGCTSQGTLYSNIPAGYISVSDQFRNSSHWLAIAGTQPFRDSAGTPFVISNLFLGGVGWTMEDLNRAYYNKMTWYDPNDYKLVVE